MVGTTNPRRIRLPLEAFLSLLVGYLVGVLVAQLLLRNELLPSTREELIGAGAALLGIPLTFLILRRLLLAGQEEGVLLLRRANRLVRLAIALSTALLSLLITLSSHQGLQVILHRMGLGEQEGFLAQSLAQDGLFQMAILALLYLFVLSVLVRIATLADGYRHLGDLFVVPKGTAPKEQLRRAIGRRTEAYTFVYFGLSLLMEGLFVYLRSSVFMHELGLQQGIAEGQGFWLWRLISDVETILPSALFLAYVFFLKRAPLAALYRDAVERAAFDLGQEGIQINYPQNVSRGPSPMEAIGIFGVLAAAVSAIVCGLVHAGVYLLLTTGVAGLLAGG